MNRSQQFLVIFYALLLAESGGASANVIRTNPADISESVDSSSPVTLTFLTPITDATELVSIGGGTVGGNESGDFLLDVKYSDGSTQQIFDLPVDIATFFQLDTIAHKPFNEGTVTGLVFRATDNGFFGTTYFLDILQGTEFEFATAPDVGAAPEPEPLTLVGAALAFLAAWRSRLWRRWSTA